MKRSTQPDSGRGATRPLIALLLLAVAAIVAALRGLLQPSSLLITVGGSLAVTWLTFPRQRIVSAWRHVTALLRESPGREEHETEATIAALKRLARIHRVDGPAALERAAKAEGSPFLATAVERLLEYDDTDDLRDALLGEARRCAAEGEAARTVLLTLGKLFPAFGLIGTLIGLALLLPQIGDGNVAAAAPSLGVAILTTLYGAILSNVVVLPIATKLAAALSRRWLVLQMIVLGAELIHRREYPTRVERALRSFAGLAPLPVKGDVTVLTERAA
jgi:chemotaxis protein MotA